MDLGVTPVVWSGVRDLFGQIWHQVGFLFAVWLLQWPELLVRKRSIVSFNKADGVLAGDGLRGGSCSSSQPMSCRGGEGRRKREASFFSGRFLIRWRRIVIDVRIQARGICCYPWPVRRPIFNNLQDGDSSSSSLLELGALSPSSGLSPVVSRCLAATDWCRNRVFGHLRPVPRQRYLEDTGVRWRRLPRTRLLLFL